LDSRPRCHVSVTRRNQPPAPASSRAAAASWEGGGRLGGEGEEAEGGEARPARVATAAPSAGWALSSFRTASRSSSDLRWRRGMCDVMGDVWWVVRGCQGGWMCRSEDEAQVSARERR